MRRGLVVVGLVVIALFGAFVWPSMYRVETIRASPGYNLPAEQMLIRTNRFTGVTETFSPGIGWVRN